MAIIFWARSWAPSICLLGLYAPLLAQPLPIPDWVTESALSCPQSSWSEYFISLSSCSCDLNRPSKLSLPPMGMLLHSMPRPCAILGRKSWFRFMTLYSATACLYLTPCSDVSEGNSVVHLEDFPNTKTAYNWTLSTGVLSSTSLLWYLQSLIDTASVTWAYWPAHGDLLTRLSTTTLPLH